MIRRSLVSIVTIVLAVAVAVGLHVPTALAQGGGKIRPVREIQGQLIVKYRPGTNAQARGFALENLGVETRVLKDFAFIRAELVEIKDMPTGVARALLSMDPNVEYAEPNYEWTLDETPNDPRFNELYGMENTGQTGGTPGADISATNAWDLFTGDPNLLLGVIDTGIDYNHPDLAANAWTNPGEIPGNSLDDDNNGFIDDVHGWDFVNDDGDPMDDNGHGTHCSGTIGGVGNNGVGVAGVNWNMKIAGIKFLSAGGSGSTDDAISSVLYAITIGCRLTSNSWGGGGFSQALLDAINAAGADGQLFVAAAGNSGANGDTSPHYPGGYDSPYIITVAATDHNDELADFSNYGLTTVDLGAPGVDILSCQPGGGYQQLSGTSMACPHVAGAAALAWGRFPNASNLQIKQLIMLKADPIPALAGRCVTGARLNVFLSIADPDSTAPGQVTDLATQNPGSTTMELTWTATGDDNGTGTASRYDVRYSTAPIDTANFNAASAVEGPDPQVAGSTETFEIAGLAYSTPYYFALKALDEFGNTGPMSNLATGTTLGAPAAGLSPGSFTETLLTGASSDQTLQITNTGAGRLDWTAPTPELAFSALFPETAIEQAPVVEPLTLAKGQEDPRPGFLSSGGPDAFGYRWVDSDEPGGPAFSWVDITGVGTLVTLTGDDALSAALPIGFSFPFYGNAFSTLRVCTNGFLSFTDAVSPYSNQLLPNTGGAQNMVAPMWDDLDFGGTSRVYVHNDGSRFIVSWVNAPHYGSGGPYTFQALLYPSGEIRYQYLTLGAPTNSATVGIQNASETVGLTTAFNTNYLHDALAVRYTPLRQWLTVSPTSGRIPAGQSQNVTVHFDATGLNGGEYDGTIHIASNAPVSPADASAHLTVIGAPNIAASPDTTHYGTEFANGSYAATITVSNDGTDALNVSGITATGPCTGVLSFAPTAFTLAPGASQAVTATWAPNAPCGLVATIDIASDDPDEATKTVHADGTAVPAPAFTVAPREFEETLVTNTAVSRSLRVMNDGGSNLDFTAETLALTAVSAGVRPRTVPVGTDATNVVIAKGDSDRDFGPVGLAAGGPDAFGYRYADSNEPGGPSFSWVDISGVGTAVPFNGDDQNQGPFPIGFSFPYYGTTHTTFRMCTNGWISFTSSSSAYANTTLPNAGSGVPENLLAAFWDDLSFSSLGDAYYHYDGNKLIVQWQGVPRLSSTQPNTFQILLYPDGRVVYQYLSMTTTTRNSHTIGIQNGSRDDGLQVIYNNDTYLQDNLAVRFSPPARFLTVTPPNGSVPPGQYVDLTVGFNAAGLYGGDYLGAVRLTTNDPQAPEFNVEAMLHVIGAPDIVATPDPIDYGNVFVGYPQIQQVSVQNTGTDELVVDEITSSDPSYSANQSSFSIPPGSQAIVDVSFNPPSAQAYPATLTVKSNDPDTPFRYIAMSGTGLIAPNALASQASMSATLPVDGTTSQTLEISNNGGSPLEWTLGASVDAAAESFVIHGQPALGKNETDPREGILAAGGPDAFGYRWKDSDEVGGPTFGWVDITGVGTQLTQFNNDDRIRTGVPLGFNMPFYGGTFSTVNICTNGWLSFTDTDSAYANGPLPNNGSRMPPNLIAPWWDDLDLRTQGSVWVHNDGSRFIVSWIDCPHYASSGPGGPYTFQAILYPSGAIEFQYLSMVAPNSSGTIGIQNAARTIGLNIVFNAAYVHDNLAVRLHRTPDWLSAAPQSGTIPAGQSTNIQVDYDAAELETGVYSGNLRLSSNDPDDGVIDVPVTLTVSDLVAVDELALPTSYGLKLAGANPARGAAVVELALPAKGVADVRLYDVRGALVRSLAKGELPAGYHRMRWDGTDAAGRRVGSGMYFVQARTAGGTFGRQVIWMP